LNAVYCMKSGFSQELFDVNTRSNVPPKQNSKATGLTPAPEVCRPTAKDVKQCADPQSADNFSVVMLEDSSSVHRVNIASDIPTARSLRRPKNGRTTL